MKDYFLITLFFFVISFGRSQDLAENTKPRIRKSETLLVYPPANHAPIHKATAVHLFAFMALIGRSDITPSDPRGLAVTRLKSTDDPDNRNDDDDLTAYGVNSGQNNIIFNSSMQGLDVYEGKGPQQKLKRPRGIACNSDGDVYIADTGNNRLVKLKNPGGYLLFVKASGKKGNKSGEYDEPRGVAVDQKNQVYVTDYKNDRIQVLDSNLIPCQIWGNATDASGTLSLYRPDAIAASDGSDPDNFTQDHFLIVVDMDGTRIQKLGFDGHFQMGVVSSEYGFDKVNLTSVAIDGFNNVWVTDAENHAIHKFDRDLRYMGTFGSPGDGENQFIEPRAIAIGKKFGQVFIADKISAQYYHIGTDIQNLNVAIKDSQLVFSFYLPETSRLTARIVDEKGKLVATLARNSMTSPGIKMLQWNRAYKSNSPLRDILQFREQNRSDSTQGKQPAMTEQLAPSGIYKIEIEAKSTYIYNRYFTAKRALEFAF
ncbi:MAG TPA: NHL repeat-containing protein [bacterium]|nr:NHL repeat-containing protein [bacterium]